MTDIRWLLKTAAPMPTRMFDAEAFVRQARVARRRRFVTWAGALLAGVITVVVPTQVGLSPAGHDQVNVETINPPTTSSPSPPPTAAPTTAPSRPPIAPSPAIGAPTPAKETRPAYAAPASPASRAAGEDMIEGCEVYSNPSPGVGGVARPAETVWSCEYVATVPAAYEGTGGTWTLDIVRDGKTITFDSVKSPSCQAIGVIQPGDHVRAHLGLRAADGTYTYASAGEREWHLRVGTWAHC